MLIQHFYRMGSFVAGSVLGFIRFGAMRAPKGGVNVQGKFYPGGQFIPGDVVASASEEEIQSILNPSSKKTQPQLPTYSASKAAKQLAVRRKYSLGAHRIAILYDGRKASEGFFVRYTDPDGKQKISDKRFRRSENAAQEAALFLAGIADKQPAAVTQQPSTYQPKKSGPKNFHYSNRDFFSRGAKTKFRDNLTALRTLKTLEIEDRPATREEQEKISKFIGWGQFPSAFADKYWNRTGWEKERQELIDLVGHDGYASAKASLTNSHYTHPDIVAAHWEMAKRLGFKGGRYLEPAVGSGFYLGFMPPELAAKTKTTAVEMEELSAKIASTLYPEADVNHSPFQDYPTPDNFYDLVGTNVPFDGKVRIFDPKYKGRPLVHDYYFQRSVDTAKPGGLIMNITSAGTMDKLDPKVREYINEHCELVSAVRFPGSAHKENAGTEVVTDMITLRKKHPGIPAVTDETPEDAAPKKTGFTGITRDSLGRLYHWRDGKRVPAPKWDDVVNIPDPDGGEPIPVNRYFADNPEQILGTLDRSGTMYTGDMKNVVKTDDYEDRLRDAIARLPEDINWADKSVDIEAPADDRVLSDKKYNEGQIVAKDGALYRYENGALIPLKVGKKDQDRALAMIAIKDKARELLADYRSGGEGEKLRSELNGLYDAFRDQYGLINSQPNKRALRDDPDLQFLLALESKGDKAAIFEKNTIASGAKADKADSIGDAVGICLNESHRIDTARIAELLDRPVSEIEAEIVKSGLAFELPSGGWESASLYLSGKTKSKLKEAQAAAKVDSKYQANVDALLKFQPPPVAYDEVGIKLGSPWVPPATINDFASDVLGMRSDSIEVAFNPVGQQWSVNFGKYAKWSSSFSETWGVKGTDVDFKAILAAALNGKSITIRSERDSEGKSHPMPEQTEAANEKVRELRDRFKEWVWDDESRRDMLAEIYNEQHNDWVPTAYDGSHLTFPGMRTDGWPLRDLQKDFVFRVISTGKGLAAHEVGLGKTASMVAASMELRRLGLAKKPTIAVLKANIDQITAEAQELYPDAKILSTADMFNAKKRQQTLNMIATGDYDMIILTHDHLNKMKMKPETLQRFMQDELDELEDTILSIKSQDAQSQGKNLSKRIIKQLESRKQKMAEDLKKALAEHKKDDIYFEDLGIDQLFVDEAHYFKSLPCTTNKGNIKGIPSTRSDRATAMFARTRWLMENNNGRGVVFATGTPIANTMAELYNMQRYLQYDELKAKGLHRFDAWADTYGEITNRLEFKVDGDIKETSRFNEFMNLPELQHLTSDFMDIQRATRADGTVLVKRPEKQDFVHSAESNDAMADFMKSIEKRATAIKGQRVLKGEENMLTICNDARKGSIDLRLVDGSAPDIPSSKANLAVQKVKELYDKHPGTAQCVFTDLGVHPDDKTGFHLIGDMTEKMVAAGIPRDQIVNFSDPTMDDVQSAIAQEKMRNGQVRVAFGSTKRLGTGTNIQKRLKAVHHLDIPYVPAYLEQRDGRVWRHGNSNAEVEVHKYVQEGSADNVWWQIVASKSNFINQYMRGGNARTMTELDAEELSPEQMIAIATGDEQVMRKFDLQREVKQLKRAAQRHKSEKARYSSILERSHQQRESLKRAMDTYQADAERVPSGDFEIMVGKTSITNRPAAENAIKESAEKVQEMVDRSAVYYRDRVPRTVARYGEFQVQLGDDGLFDIQSPSGQVYKAGASLRSVEATLRGIKKDVEKYQKLIQDHDSDTEKMKEELKREFRHTERLKSLEAELEALK